LAKRGLERLGGEASEDAIELLVKESGSDGRQMLNMLDSVAAVFGTKLTKESVRDALLESRLRYDKHGEEHYNTVSAFIKSMRAGQPDAALYYLARMVEGGEDPKFIARRMLIFASEDVGLADPNALSVASGAFRAAEVIGYPECAINLGHAAVYLSNAPKDRTAYNGIKSAIQTVRSTGNLPIPMKLRNAPTKLMKDLGYGKIDESNPNRGWLPDEIAGTRFWVPKNPEMEND
jgi:putative ATPase